MPQLQDMLPLKPHPEKHLPCIILADCSNSMAGAPIAELNQGLVEFGKALRDDPIALSRIEVCIISFADGVKTELDFCSVEDYHAPALTAGGLAAFNEALSIALDQIDARKLECRQLGTPYYRPWLFVLADGSPTDDHLEADTRDRFRDYIANKKVNYIPLGIGNASIPHLQSYYPQSVGRKPALKANQTNFKEVFSWLAASIVAICKADSTSGTIESAPVPSTITLIR